MPIEGKARALLGLGVAGCVCALLFAVPSWQIHAQDREAASSSDVAGPPSGAEASALPMPVEITQAVAYSEARTRSFAGTVEALKTVDLAFQVSGQLVEFPVIAGDRVTTGDLIGQLDKADFQLALDRARASYDLARSEFTRASALSDRGVATDAQLDAVRAQLAQAETALMAQDAFGVRIEHARYLTLHDLLAMTALQYSNQGLEPVWDVLETALLARSSEAWLDAPPEPVLRHVDGEVRMALLTPADWRKRHVPDEKNEARLARGLAMYEARQRQIAAVLQAHGIEVQFVQVAAGQDPADALR